jgi:late competence protein required for DNA uptake (superfamily II DNA/RNA helicase)
MIGLPLNKSGESKPLFDYQRDIYNTIIHQDKRYLWIKKATGLGISEFFLRYMAWLCLKDNSLVNKRICIVTGPRVDLAITLIERMKHLFVSAPPDMLDTKETVIELNGCIVEAYPSHHLDAMRGLTDVKLILIDEGDFFPPGEQENARIVSERYIGKSDPIIVMVSTPHLPGGLFEKIELEDDKTCIYHRMFLPYTVGLGKVYTQQEIAEAMKSPSFQSIICSMVMALAMLLHLLN